VRIWGEATDRDLEIEGHKAGKKRSSVGRAVSILPKALKQQKKKKMPEGNQSPTIGKKKRGQPRFSGLPSSKLEKKIAHILRKGNQIARYLQCEEIRSGELSLNHEMCDTRGGDLRERAISEEVAPNVALITRR